jgi:hypothetical protein
MLVDTINSINKKSPLDRGRSAIIILSYGGDNVPLLDNQVEKEVESIQQEVNIKLGLLNEVM